MIPEVADHFDPQPREVDARVFEKLRVFSGQNRSLELFGNLVIGHQNPSFQGKLTDYRAVRGIHVGHHIRTNVLEFLDLRQINGVAENDSDQSPGQDGDHDQEAIAHPEKGTAHGNNGSELSPDLREHLSSTLHNLEPACSWRFQC